MFAAVLLSVIGSAVHAHPAQAQSAQTQTVQTQAATPPTDVLTLAAFTTRVSAQHPVVRQARLAVEQAREEQRIARGAFDPTLSAEWDRKTFGSVAYYDYLSAALSVPTPLGIDAKLGFDRTSGTYISPDRRTPARGLFTAGISIPIGQRMLTDERRTAITVARALRDGAVADRDGTVNRVLLAATREYARWFEAEQRVTIATEGIRLAQFRFVAVRQRVLNGEAAALDTVEAALEVARRDVQRIEAVQARFAARLAVEAYLWDARGLPDTLSTATTPVAEYDASVSTDSSEFRALIARAQRVYPDVQRADARVDQAAAQQRLASQQRLPLIAASIGALGARDDAFSGTTSLDDAKLGLTARTPLLLLKERGRFTAASLRVEQSVLDRERARREVAVIVRTAAAEADAVSQALALQRTVVAYARTLVRGEQLRFDAGEGTLFLVNTRERALLDEELRLAAIEARRLVSLGELAAATGVWLEPVR